MTFAVDFQRGRIVAAARANTRPMTPVVNLLAVRGRRAEELAALGRKRPPQRAVGFDGRDRVPAQFIDDDGQVIQRDVMDRQAPPLDVRHLFELRKNHAGHNCWTNIETGKVWRGRRGKNSKHAKGAVTAQAPALEDPIPSDQKILNGISLSLGVGEIIDHWLVDFEDNEIHPELAQIPHTRLCRAIDEKNGSFCCSEKRADGASYCASHQLQYTRKGDPRQLRAFRKFI